MTDPSERLCAGCGKVYSLKYTDKSGYTYLLNTTHCSKSCAGKASGPKGCIQPDIGRAALKEEVQQYIRDKDRYCTKEEFCAGTHHSSKLLTKHGLTSTELNAELGFVRPRSTFQDTIGTALRSVFPEVLEEQRFDGLVGNTNHPLQVDFYIPSLNLVIEADGAHHQNASHPWATWNNGKVQEYDRIKDEYFRQRGIPVIRIPYKKKFSSSDIQDLLD